MFDVLDEYGEIVALDFLFFLNVHNSRSVVVLCYAYAL